VIRWIVNGGAVSKDARVANIRLVISSSDCKSREVDVAGATALASLSLGKQVRRFCNNMSTHRSRQCEGDGILLQSAGGDFAGHHSTSLLQSVPSD